MYKKEALVLEKRRQPMKAGRSRFVLNETDESEKIKSKDNPVGHFNIFYKCVWNPHMPPVLLKRGITTGFAYTIRGCI